MSLRRYYPTPTKAPGASRFPDLRDAAYSAWIRTLPCCVSGVRAGELITVPFPNGKTGQVRAIIEAAHVKSRGAGGDDFGNLVPLEMSKHRELHRLGRKSFPTKYGVDLQAIADELARRYRETHTG